MIGKRYEQPKFQSDFYRNQYHKLLRLMFIVSLIILLLSLTIIYYLLNPNPPQYYASTTTGEIITMTSTE